MSKSVRALLLVVVLVFSFHYATAEDLSSMTDEELLELRMEINNELAARKEAAEIPEGSTIADLFPDHILAMKVRDAIGAISTKDPVTQDELDTIRTISVNGAVSGETHDLKDVTGIEYLRNLEAIHFVRQDNLTELPDSIGSCVHLRVIDLRSSGIKELPNSICDLIELQELDVSYSELDKLPDDIGNLQALKELDISHTKIMELPASIRNLTLDKFRREGMDLD